MRESNILNFLRKSYMDGQFSISTPPPQTPYADSMQARMEEMMNNLKVNQFFISNPKSAKLFFFTSVISISKWINFMCVANASKIASCPSWTIVHNAKNLCVQAYVCTKSTLCKSLDRYWSSSNLLLSVAEWMDWERRRAGQTRPLA